MADKLKMSQKKFMLILIPILAILLGTVIAVTAVNELGESPPWTAFSVKDSSI